MTLTDIERGSVMLGRIGSRVGAVVFMIQGFMYLFDARGMGGSDGGTHYLVTMALIAFLMASVFYGVDQITTAIRELKDDESKEGDD